jgi:hypothetical protein
VNRYFWLRTAGSRSGGPSLLGHDLILAARYRSDARGFGLQGWWRWVPKTIFCGGARLGSQDFTLNGAPGVKLTGHWVGHDQRVTRDPPGAKTGLEEGSGGVHDDGGGSAWRRLAGACVPATRANVGP